MYHLSLMESLLEKSSKDAEKVAYSSFTCLLSTSLEKYLSKHFFFLLLLPYLDVVEHDHETHQAIVDYNTYKLSYDIIYKKLNFIEYHLYLNYQSLQFKLLRLPWI